MLGLLNEKSWSIRLIDGYISGNQVKSKSCGNCESVSRLVANNFSDPNMVLYGCTGHKCKNKLIRLKFYSGSLDVPMLTKAFVTIRNQTSR
jgi:hypothetical protein